MTASAAGSLAAPSARASTPLRALRLPAAFTLVFAAFALLPSVRASPPVFFSILGAAAVLLAWCGVLAVTATRAGRTLSTELVLRRPHWMQPLVHLSIYTYWGLHWPLVFESFHLIVAQVFFAYAFDQLMVWSHRETYYLGFGPVPIVLSGNLFLWFKPEWFYLQFVLVACGFAAKEFFRWERGGEKVHIFNPSSFPLALASLVFVLFGGVEMTWGREIATAISAPAHMFELLFVLSLPAQLIFGVAIMTVPAVLTTFTLSTVYDAVTHSSFFFGPITTASFIGMLLLFTDPSTAPRSELGRVFYGVLYGASVFVLYGLLDFVGSSTIYDKLLLVPVLNLSVRALDRLAARPWLRGLDLSRLAPRVQGVGRNFGFVTVWLLVFLGVRAAHGVGDLHPANRLPFWQKACAEDRRNGCRYLDKMETAYCEHGSGWACNELGLASAKPGGIGGPQRAAEWFGKACAQGFLAGCGNARMLPSGMPLRAAPPRLRDYEEVLDPRTLGPPRNELELLQRACDQGWKDACEAASAAAPQVGGGARPDDPVRRARAACSGGDPLGCKTLGLMYRRGDGVKRDDQKALACELNVVEACAALAPAAPAAAP